MKRLLAATSAALLMLSGVAFAQTTQSVDPARAAPPYASEDERAMYETNPAW